MSFSPKVFHSGTRLWMRQTLMVDYARRRMEGGILIACPRYLLIIRCSCLPMFFPSLISSLVLPSPPSCFRFARWIAFHPKTPYFLSEPIPHTTTLYASRDSPASVLSLKVPSPQSAGLVLRRSLGEGLVESDDVLGSGGGSSGGLGRVASRLVKRRWLTSS
jgi:hypothetical protein